MTKQTTVINCEITAKKIKTIDIDNIKLAIEVKVGSYPRPIEFEAQYNVRTNTCHINDEVAERHLDNLGIDINEIGEQIEERKIQIC